MSSTKSLKKVPHPEIDRSIPYGLALGGGGTRGGYEIGVWQFLEEEKIPIGAVAGTSIGSANGAMLVEGALDRALEAWLSIDISLLTEAGQPQSEEEKEKTKARFFSDFAQDMGSLAKRFIENRGIDTAPLRAFLSSLIHEDRVRASSIDYHLVTVDVTNLEPRYVKLEDIPSGQLIDYILASCSVPIFKLPEIDGSKFIDGGFHDNIPVAPLYADGYTKIIAVDLSSMGPKRSLHTQGVDLIHIKNSAPLGATFQFDLDQTKTNIRLGYLDAKKTFGLVEGIHYYLRDVPQKSPLLAKVNTQEMAFLNRMLSLPKNPLIPSDLAYSHLQKLLAGLYGEDHEDADFVLASLEITGQQLGVDRLKEYSPDELLDQVLKKYQCLRDNFDPKENNLDRLLQSLAQKDKARIMANRYLPVILEDNSPEQNDGLFPLLSLSLPRYSVAALFLLLLRRRQEKKDDCRD